MTIKCLLATRKFYFEITRASPWQLVHVFVILVVIRTYVRHQQFWKFFLGFFAFLLLKNVDPNTTDFNFHGLGIRLKKRVQAIESFNRAVVCPSFRNISRVGFGSGAVQP